MPEKPSIPEAFLVAILFVLASPILLVKAVARLIARRRTNAVVRYGFVVCPTCRAGNRLDVLVTCPKCHFAEFRSLALPCSECGYAPAWLVCSGCGASVRLP